MKVQKRKDTRLKSPPEAPSDEDLMVAYGGGDEEAFLLLFRRYRLKVFNYFLRYLGDRSAAEDLLQTTFLRIHRVRKSYRPSAAFSTWLFTIAINLLRDYKLSARKQSKVIELDEVREKIAVAGGLSEPSILAEEKTPELMVGEKEIADQIREAVQSLPSEQKEVILLAKYQDFTYEEIAEILNITVNAAKVRAHRAMKSLGNIVKEKFSTLPR